MFFRKNVVLPAILLLCASCLNAQNDSSQKAKDIFKQGKENMKKMTYKATLPNTKMTTVIYNKGNPDGTNCYRYESKSENYTYLTIKNQHGDFELIGNTALKANFKQGRDEMSEEGEQAEYSMAEGKHKNIPCYIVTKKTKLDEGRYESFIKSFSGVNYLISNYSPEQLRELFENTFPATDICYIGKKDGFTYEHIVYNVHGLKHYSVKYDNVELNIPLDNGLFKIDGKFAVRESKNRDEYFKIMMELMNKEMEPRLKKLMQQRMIKEKLKWAVNTSLTDRINRITGSFDIDKIKKYSGSNTYLSDFLSL